MAYPEWMTNAAWWASAAERVQPQRLPEDAVSQDQLAALIVGGAVLVTVTVWVVMHLSSKLVGLFKSVLFIWFCMALYNRVAEAAAASASTVQLVAFLYNVSGGTLPWVK